MRLRSGRAIVEMVRPRNILLLQNNITVTQQPVGSMGAATRTSSPLITNEYILTPMINATLLPRVMVGLLGTKSILTTLRVTHAIIGDPRPFLTPSFTLPQVSRDYPYGMPTAMMAGLHSHASMFADNNATIVSLLNLYATSSPVINWSNNTTVMHTLTTNSMMFIRKQMDESNHEMVNMFTQQISTVFSPLIHNTN